MKIWAIFDFFLCCKTSGNFEKTHAVPRISDHESVVSEVNLNSRSMSNLRRWIIISLWPNRLGKNKPCAQIFQFSKLCPNAWASITYESNLRTKYLVYWKSLFHSVCLRQNDRATSRGLHVIVNHGKRRNYFKFSETRLPSDLSKQKEKLTKWLKIGWSSLWLRSLLILKI